MLVRVRSRKRDYFDRGGFDWLFKIIPCVPVLGNPGLRELVMSSMRRHDGVNRKLEILVLVTSPTSIVFSLLLDSLLGLNNFSTYLHRKMILHSGGTKQI